MTGWRVGWLVTRSDLGPKLAQLNEFFVSHAATFSQIAARTALAEGEGELRRMIASLKENRDFCIDALRRMPGLTVPEPDGAFYVFPGSAGWMIHLRFVTGYCSSTKWAWLPALRLVPAEKVR